MIPVYRRIYSASAAAVKVTGKTILIYDVPADAVLAVWDGCALISETMIGYQLANIYQQF